jgi:hypothetical protein
LLVFTPHNANECRLRFEGFLRSRSGTITAFPDPFSPLRNKSRR